MSIVVSMDEVGPWRKQLRVEVPAPEVQAETDRVVRELGRRVELPGFRRGKVPAQLVLKRFGKDIEREVVDRLLPRYWREAKEESHIDPLLPPEVDEVGDLKPGEPLHFVATVDVRPEIEIGRLDGFALPEGEVEPTDEEVTETVEDLRRQAAEWVVVERPAARGDLVRAEISQVPDASPEATEGEEAAAEEPASAPQRIQVELGDEGVWEELTLALTGLAAGQETTFSRREAAAAEGGEPAAVLERTFEVEVKEVRERDLPPVDDALARRVGEFETVDELREGVRKSLRNRKESDLKRNREQALLEELRARHPLTPPQGVVDHELQHMLNDYAESLARQGVDVEHGGIDWDRLAQDARPQAVKRVHAQLVLDAIAEKETIEVSNEEFEAFLAVLARANGKSVPAFRHSLEESGKLDSLRGRMRRDKVIERLLGEEAQEPAPAESSAAP